MVDRYTKAILTIIAACLAIIAFADLRPISKADAQSGQVHVFIDGAANFALQFAGPLQVRGQ
jgi:hypothetical protein